MIFSIFFFWEFSMRYISPVEFSKENDDNESNILLRMDLQNSYLGISITYDLFVYFSFFSASTISIITLYITIYYSLGTVY